MLTKLPRRQFITSSLSAIAIVPLSGCGTLLYSERMGQRRGGFQDVDWTVAGMDAIGLVFFFVPGVIAFAVDYHNGTLFYPPGYYSQTQPEPLKSIDLPENDRSIAQIESTLSREIGQPIELKSSNVIARKLSSVKQFWKMHSELSANSDRLS